MVSCISLRISAMQKKMTKKLKTYLFTAKFVCIVVIIIIRAFAAQVQIHDDNFNTKMLICKNNKMYIIVKHGHITIINYNSRTIYKRQGSR